jgi:Sulfotransferase family
VASQPEPITVRPDEPELAVSFRKDPAEEAFLARLNATLAGFEDEGYRDLPEELPTLHVVGAPRSGTTLLYQVIAGGLDVASVTNLVAAFWRAPVTGLRLARALGVDGVASGFESAFGRTNGIREPHEFGYFWNHHLNYRDLAERGPEHGETIDWARLALVIRNMAAAAGRPMAFKPMLLVWHLERMVAAMPRTCYVWVRRDRPAAALSLLRMRRSLFGADTAWASLRPRDPLDGGPPLADEPPWRQVAAQVVLLERTIAEAARRLGPERVLELRYEELCADPVGVLERARALLGAHGHAPALLTPDLPAFSPERNDALAAEYGARVAAAVAHYERLYSLGG